MFSSAFRKFRKARKSQLGNVLGHAKNYLFGDVAIKGLGFMSLPIFTRLMDKTDYGIVSVLVASMALLSTISTANASDCIARYYYEKDKNDFGEFLSSLIQFVLIIQIPFVLIMFAFREWLMNMMGLPPELFYFMIIGIAFLAIQNFFRAILVSQKKSRPYAAVNVAKGYGAFGLSWILLVMATGAPYLLRTTGIVMTQFFAGIWMAIKVNSNVVWSRLNSRHILYSIKFAIPRLPFVLSGTILSQFDRVMISGLLDPAEAGLYSVAYNVGGLALLAVGALSPALLPNFYQMMNDKDYKTVDKLNLQIYWLVILLGCGLMILGKPILILLVELSFQSGASIIPVVVLGYMFFALTGVYNRYVGFYKMTILQSIAAILAGGLNVILNWLWIPQFGISAAAFATLVCFAIQALITWLLISHYASGHVTSIRKFALPVLVSIAVFIISIGLI